MHETIVVLGGVRITGWKVVGYLGVLMFSARWVIQMWASRKARKPVVPAIFWVISMLGSLMCLAYFVFGRNDSVGVMAYLFPCGVSAYNLHLHFKHEKSKEEILTTDRTEAARPPPKKQENHGSH
ncbi:MAG: lipid-A-disaccharide synthase N-terminal domain-containing protein [Lentisphaerae bacterium]|nr:lipid-A-disaccharide synthase N-terminal domain-containing protein [Lentisphaerota bacterium]